MKYLKYHIRVFFLLLLLVLLSGCGYRFAGRGDIPAGFGSICVSIFENRTSEINFENIIVNDVIYELTRSGQNVVRTVEMADSVLTGEILSAVTDSATRTSSLTSVEKKLSIVLGVSLKKKNGETLWEKNFIKYEQLYAADGDNESEQRNRRYALTEISKKFATDLYGMVTQDF